MFNLNSLSIDDEKLVYDGKNKYEIMQFSDGTFAMCTSVLGDEYSSYNLSDSLWKLLKRVDDMEGK